MSVVYIGKFLLHFFGLISQSFSFSLNFFLSCLNFFKIYIYINIFNRHTSSYRKLLRVTPIIDALLYYVYYYVMIF